MSFELRQKLARVAGRIRSLRLWSGLAICWLVWAAVGILLLRLANSSGWDRASLWPKLAALAAFTAFAWTIVALRSARDQRLVARRVEARHPELATLLLTAVEVASAPRNPGKGPTYLQARVIREALAHGRNYNWTDAVSNWKLRAAKAAQFVSLALLIGVCAGLAGRGGTLAGTDSSQRIFPEIFGTEYEVAVDPGNVELERGTSLLVVAEFSGAVPPDAMLVVNSDATDQAASADASSSQSIIMVRSLDDPKFAGRVASVASDLRYRVEFAGGQTSETYRVTVFDYPELVRADAKLEFLTYTSLTPTVVEDVRHVTAVEGTRLTLVCRLNKEVVEAQLVDTDHNIVNLQQDEAEKSVYRASWELAKSQRFKLNLVDRDGRGSRLPAEIVVNVSENKPPKIAFERPGRDVEVSPLEELQLKATVTDDFGVERYGVSYMLGGDEPREVPLTPAGVTAPPSATAKERAVDYLVDFESLKVEPDQLLSYFVWAEDFGPDGQLRRTMSDMYFAEVRPFEEIYRQGEQPSASEQQQREQQRQQGQSGAAEQAGELAEMQKEIINATWKLIRRETAAEPTPEFVGDTRLIAESQQAAIETLGELVNEVQDAESQAHVEAAGKQMTEALEQLTKAVEGPATAPLRPALGDEQAAYQALLKLRAREFQVTRGQRQQQQGPRMASRGNRSERQLQQLELSNEENRYETERSAAAPNENQAQRESREILNRLKDLARRQEDLNERLRELQSALQQAESERRRQELERELKRLRDQQQEILRDTDELMSRMDQSQNQQAAQDAREQMAEGRSRIQQASESLEQGQLSQALTEGTRAERQLSEVRDQFRQQAANQFTQEMTEMRRAARDLDDQQQQLSQQLTEQQNEAGRSLRGTGSRAEAQESLAEQRRNLGGLLDRMKQTIQEAEQPEPLLARQLYDTLREANQQRVDDALEITQRLLDVGIEREAGEAMRTAGQGVRNLRQGVERAAESVLGDEAEALRRAQQEVERLANELDREIDEGRGEATGDQQADEEGTSSQGGQGRNADEQSDREQGDRRGNADAENQQDRDGQPNQETGPQNSRQPGQGQQQQSQDGERRQGGRNEQGEGQAGERREGQRPNGQDRDNGERQNEEQGGQEENDSQGPGSRQGDDRSGGMNGNRQSNRDRRRGVEAPQDNRERQPGDEQADQNEEGGVRGGANRAGQPLRGGGREGGANRPGGIERFLEGDEPSRREGPITGDNFRDWADRIGDVEEMLDDPELRSEAARIRDRAAEARTEFKRHSKEPDWTQLQQLVAEPLNELSRRISEEIRRRESPDSLVPIDRDPVPPKFSDSVRRYYERLGSGE